MNVESFRVKLAVALACIRNKPADITAREYAERLCTNYKISQLLWKQKWEESESEVLHLRQQLVLQQSGVLAAGHEQHTEEDCNFSQSLFPTPPASGSHGNQPLLLKTSDSLTKHTLFLNQVITLKSASSCSEEGLQDLTTSSVLNSLGLLRCCIGAEELSWKVQFECVDSIVTLMDKTKLECVDDFTKKIGDLTKAVSDLILSTNDASYKVVLGLVMYGHQNQVQIECEDSIVTLMDKMKLECADDFTKKICDLIRAVLHLILSTNDASYKIQEHRSKLLGKLGSGTETAKPVIETLLNYVYKFSEELRKTVINKDSIDPDHFCSMYYIIHGLEQCINQHNFSSQSREFKHCVNEQLEQCLLHVTDTYPVFAHALWKICGKICQ